MSPTRHKLIAVFIALSLSIPIFYISRQPAITNGHGSIAPFAFEGLENGIHSGHFKLLSTVWKPRIGSLWCAAAWLDIWLPTTDEGYKDTCGSYHAVWFGATLLLLVMALKEPIFPIMAVFGGTVYALSVCTYNSFYDNVIIMPWDLPSMFVWALAFIFWLRKHYWQMVVAIIFGTLFKESVAVLGVLLFFAAIGWRRRLILFATAFIGCVVVKLVVTFAVLGHPAIFTAEHTSFSSLWGNITHFCAWEFHPHLNTILWCNGGLMLGAFFLGARNTEDAGIIMVLALFAVLLTVATVIDNDCFEVRQWTDCLPVLAIYFQKKLYVQKSSYEEMLSPAGFLLKSDKVKTENEPK